VVASIASPPANGFHVGPLDIHVYGLMYVFAVIAAVAITVRRWEAIGGSRRLVYEVAAWGFPAGILGGRLYFDLTSSDLVPNHWWGPFAIWDGGLGIWGGIAAGTLAGLIVLRRRRADIPRFLDAAAPALLVAQAIGRVGNYFNQELFGGPTSLPWGLEISPAHRPPGYEAYSTFQPTFLYELIWNLGLAGFLVWLGHHRRIRAPGLFALYVTGYSGFRIFEELLRVDPAHHLLGFRLNFWVACALTVVGASWFVAIQRRGRASSEGKRVRRWPALFALGWATVAAVGCGGAPGRSSASLAGPQPRAAAHAEQRPWKMISWPLTVNPVSRPTAPSGSSTATRSTAATVPQWSHRT
jgi:prolipoprotein diacylglyceryl transferase